MRSVYFLGRLERKSPFKTSGVSQDAQRERLTPVSGAWQVRLRVEESHAYLEERLRLSLDAVRSEAEEG